jgi:hypothetical protein
MMNKLAVSLGVLAIFGTSCGGSDGGIDEGPSAMEGTVEPTAAKSTVTRADGLSAAISSQNGDQIAGAAVALSVGAMGAVRPKTGKALTVMDQVIASTTGGDAAAMTGSKTCTPTGCTFEGFGNGAFTVSGSVSASDAPNGAKKIVWTLTGKGSDISGSSAQLQNLNFEFTWKGDITASATSLTGAAGATWTGSGTAQGQSFSFNYGSLVKFQDITLMAHCPTAGSVFGKWWVSAHSGGQDQSQAYQATHTFNGCVR